METEFTIIGNTEEPENCDYRPCASDETNMRHELFHEKLSESNFNALPAVNQEQYNFRKDLDSPSPINLEVVAGSSGLDNNNSLEEDVPTESDDVVYVSNIQEEPIDLTFDNKSNMENDYRVKEANASYLKSNPPTISNAKRIIIRPTPTHQLDLGRIKTNSRGLKRVQDPLKITSSEMDQYNNWIQISNNQNAQPALNQPYPMASKPQKAHSQPSVQQNPSSYAYGIVRGQQPSSAQLIDRQQEILNVAKSIFSKRTRTLYHWMYPTASKLQIKQEVSRTWESMAAQEKNIYIAQVLGKFGYATTSLMVNPQLGQIKELPPPVVAVVPESNPKTSELQKAISSISNETDSFESSFSTEQPAKKQRLTNKKLAQNLSKGSNEFDDDPELSQELAQFSIMFKNQF